MERVALSIVAGALTTLSPCVLPVLPLVVGSALQEHRLGPVAQETGMTLSFAAVGIALASTGVILGIQATTLHGFASLMLIAIGTLLISTTLQAAFARLVQPLSFSTERFLHRISPQGLWGQLLIGALLGIIWSPCSGPTLGGAVALAAKDGASISAVTIMAAFGVGASLPLLTIAYSSRRILHNNRALLQLLGQHGKVLFGGTLIIMGSLIYSGADKRLEAVLLDLLPEWTLNLSTRY